MTVVSYPLGKPHPPALRGGDCRARDLARGRNVHGPHIFRSPADCWIGNGLLRATVVDGGEPALDVEVYRGAVTVEDVYEDVYRDTYGGATSEPEWLPAGRVTFDSPSVPAVATAVRMVSVHGGSVTLRFLASAVGDVFVALHQGERMLRVQHGSTRSVVSTTRRIQWTATPSPVGTAFPGRVEETAAAPGMDGLNRFVAALTLVTPDAPTFALATSAVTTARLGAGVGSEATLDRPLDLHRQLADATRVLADVNDEDDEA